jgi:hypothetical protein
MLLALDGKILFVLPALDSDIFERKKNEKLL